MRRAGRRTSCAASPGSAYRSGSIAASCHRARRRGNPYPSVYDSCLDLLGIADRRRMLAIGDSLRTDIAGAAGAGIDSLLIAGGIHAAEFGNGDAIDLDRVAAAIEKSGTRPIGV